MMKVLVLVIIIATVIEVENRKHKVLKHRHKHALRESRPERDAGGIQLKPHRNKIRVPGMGKTKYFRRIYFERNIDLKH